MHRIDQRFVELRRAGRKALCVYLCVGDPSLEASGFLAVEAIDAGADILELGVPFSDPTADGPTLARAAERAIAAGATLERVLDVASRIRARSEAPLVLFTYYNPVLVAGEAKVARLAREAGVDALLVVDLPPEEAGPLRGACAAEGLGVVPLVSPTSHAARVEAIRRASMPLDGAPRAFVYSISMTGVTGASPSDLAAAARDAEAMRRSFDRPVLVGFGIDSGVSARLAAGEATGGADGVVVGTALARRIEQAASGDEQRRVVRSFVGDLRRALDEPA
ncbi:tryptophan synthase subunit alpha [Polyangium sp. 15x6]|uniref:tryptophan synthase subunit alpha n=1 Tax=Polyangium sp. 15x6 TaxID=3042687 RepID=UPI00249A82D1|nr:tryptophan synthase subunit alpha [Polyangium sp. 15x6]MDI3284359.1 tryptophan synthase subunit alpha [Polyangium sp. 15x6]